MRREAKVKGVYQLHLQLNRPTRITVGRLGTFYFPAGRYIYTGSAQGGLEARLARHRRSEKVLHWHIDYFLQYADLVAVTVVVTSERLECALNAQTLQQPGARIIAPRFGSSDCRCPAHLIYTPLPACPYPLAACNSRRRAARKAETEVSQSLKSRMSRLEICRA